MSEPKKRKPSRRAQSLVTDAFTAAHRAYSRASMEEYGWFADARDKLLEYIAGLERQLAAAKYGRRKSRP